MQGHDVDQRRPRILKKEPRVGLVEIEAASSCPNQDEVDDYEQEKSCVDFQAASQAAYNYRGPTLLAQRAAIGKHAGIAGHEHENFRSIAKSVVAKRQPLERVAGSVVNEDEPERKPAISIEPQVTL